jgi:GT2 family glycosyltransferase
MASISISIVTYKADLGLFRSLLESLRQSVIVLNSREHIEPPVLCILDNSEDMKAIRQLKAVIESVWTSSAVSVEQAGENLGYGKGHNKCMQGVSSTYHLVLNPDVLLQQDALLLALDYMESNPDIGLLTPYVSSPSGEQSFLCKQYPSVMDLFLRGFVPANIRKRFQYRLDRYELRDVTHDAPVKGIPIASGCFMLFRTSVLNTMGGFSPRYFMYFEDFDLCMRMHGRADIAYVPSVKIIHAGGDAAKKGLRHIWMFSVSAYRFFSCWGWKWS